MFDVEHTQSSRQLLELDPVDGPTPIRIMPGVHVDEPADRAAREAFEDDVLRRDVAQELVADADDAPVAFGARESPWGAPSQRGGVSRPQSWRALPTVWPSLVVGLLTKRTAQDGLPWVCLSEPTAIPADPALPVRRPSRRPLDPLHDVPGLERGPARFPDANRTGLPDES